MDEQTCLSRMVPPDRRRDRKEQMRGGIIQVMITRACDKSCFHCTQGSNFGGKPMVMTIDQFEQAILSLKGYWGVIGIFGGDPALHPQFEDICAVFRKHIPFEQRGLWCNNLINENKAKAARQTFNPTVCNLNVHTDRQAWELFRTHWPEARPFGLDTDSRHGPVFVSMKDLGIPEQKRWELISNCDINQHWSALIGVFRGQLRAWFCEIAGAQSMLHEADSTYPDTGLDPTICYDYVQAHDTVKLKWWQLPMHAFQQQVRQHCHDCGVPLRGYGEMAMAVEGTEQVSAIHSCVAKPKKDSHRIQIVTTSEQLGDTLRSAVDYLGNGRRPKQEIICRPLS